MKVCVFCASNSDIAEAHVAAATQIGEWIGRNGHTLVWGGCNVGLMDVVGRAALAAGARTIAVIPRFLLERDLAFPQAHERVVTPDVASRKAAMRQHADVFVALPGGIGTWEEALEVLALKKLGQLDQPLAFANLEGYYDPLLEQIQRSIDGGFSLSDLPQLYRVTSTTLEILAFLEACGRSANL